MKNDIVVYLLLVLSLAFAGCGGGGGGGGGGSTKPQVTKAFNDSATTKVNSAISITVLTNDTVADGGTLTITGKTDGASGSVTIDSGAKTVTYTPNTGTSGSDTFTYTISDGIGGTSLATVTVTVTTNPTPPPPPPTTTGPYVPMSVTDDAGTSIALKAVDTQSPYAIRTLENTAVAHVQPIYQSDYNATTQLSSNFKPAYVFYWKDNHFWRVSLAAGSNLAPQQVTSDTFADICGDINISNQALDPLTTAILVMTAGKDGLCDSPNDTDNEISIIRLGFSATDTAIKATNVIPSFGKIKVLDDGFLAEVQNMVNTPVTYTLRYYDANFSNPIDLTDVTGPTSVSFEQVLNHDSFVFADNELRWFNGTSHTLGSSLLPMASPNPGDFTCDASSCYFADLQTDNTYSLFSVPANGSDNAAPLTSGISGSNINLHLTANYIFYAIDNSGGTAEELYRFPKAPGSVVLPFPVDSAERIPLVFTSRGYVYYEKQTGPILSVTASTAVINNEALTNEQSFVNSVWAGLADFEFSNADRSVDGSIFLANGATDISKGVGGASLQSYALGTGIIKSTIGTIPSSLVFLGLFNSSSYGDIRIGTGSTASTSMTSGYQYDMYIINPNATNVITNLTNTADLNETPAYY